MLSFLFLIKITVLPFFLFYYHLHNNSPFIVVCHTTYQVPERSIFLLNPPKMIFNRGLVGKISYQVQQKPAIHTGIFACGIWCCGVFQINHVLTNVHIPNNITKIPKPNLNLFSDLNFAVICGPNIAPAIAPAVNTKTRFHVVNPFVIK